MDVKEAIQKRRSTRTYNGKAVEFEKITKILKSGMQAPSSGDLKDTKYIILTEKNKIAQLCERCKQQYWMAQAPVAIIVCAGESKVEQLYGIRGKRLYAIQNAAAAVQNMMLRACSLGLSTCWVGNFDENYVNDEFNIPEGYELKQYLPSGIAMKNHKKKNDFKMESRVFFETFGNKIKNYDLVSRQYGKRFQNKLDEVGKKVEKTTKSKQSSLRKSFEELKNKLTKNK